MSREASGLRLATARAELVEKPVEKGFNGINGAAQNQHASSEIETGNRDEHAELWACIEGFEVKHERYPRFDRRIYQQHSSMDENDT